MDGFAERSRSTRACRWRRQQQRPRALAPEAGAQIGDALHEAILGGHGEVVEDLLENGASIAAEATEDGRTLLHSAAVVGKPEMVQLLMLKGADMMRRTVSLGYSPLHHAVR